MRKFGLLMGILFLASLSAMAQKVEAFVGYSLVDVNGTTLNGGVGSVAFDVVKHVAIVGEVAGYVPSSGSGHAYTFMGGPKVSFKIGPIIPFGQALFGDLHTTGGGSSSDNFAAAWGGGVDLNVNRHFAIRLGQFEDLYTQVGGGSQNNFRYSGGVVFKL